MDIKILSSGSHGNCYWIHDGHTSLLLEAGISWKRIQEALDFRAHELAGVLVTHGHMDHIGHAKEAMKTGLDVYCSKEAAQRAKLDGHRLNFINPDRSFTLRTWTVLPFSAVHDLPTLGFLLSSVHNEKLLYLTDSGYVVPRFAGLNYVMLECNHIDEILTEKILSGALPAAAGHRIRRSHMNLKTAKELLLANNLSAVRAVYLLHMSNTNSDEARMVREIQQVCGVPVYAC